MTLTTIILILATHFIADFMCQTDEQAKNKSKSNFALSLHVSIYTCGLYLLAVVLIFTYFREDGGYLMAWVFTNGALHWITDYYTSRLNKHLWETGNVHNFFVGVGFDQLIHYICLFATYQYIVL